MFQSWLFCQCGSLMSLHPTGRHGNAVLIISFPCWEATSTGANYSKTIPSLATAEPREDIKPLAGTSQQSGNQKRGVPCSCCGR